MGYSSIPTNGNAIFFFVLFSQDALQELAEDMADDDLDVRMCWRAFFSEVGLYG